MTGVDWQKVHARLAQAKSALEQASRRSAKDPAAILRARARALAQEPGREESSRDALETIEFIVAQETYAVEACWVREVYPLKELVPLPGTPAFVQGIVNIRGLVVSVVDIKKFFDLPERGLTDLDKVIVLANGAMAFGLLADRIVGSRRVAASELHASLPTLSGIRQQYLKGITADRTTVLAADKLLSDPAIVVREEAQT